METFHSRLANLEVVDPTQTLETQSQKIDELRRELTQAMSTELEQMRMQSLHDFKDLRASLEQQREEGSLLKRAEENEAAVTSIKSELQESTRAQKAMEAEVSDLRVQLASAEERAKMLQERQEELRKERASFEEERRSLRRQAEDQWQKLSSSESELHQLKAEYEMQKMEIARLNSSRTEDGDAIRKEREVWRERETTLQRNVAELRASLDEAKRQAEVEALKAESRHRDAVAELRLQLERLEAESTSRADQLNQATQLRERLEAERAIAQQREEEARQESVQELQDCQRELEEARAREHELMSMLNEVQDSIITVSGAALDDIPSDTEADTASRQAT